MSDINNTRYLNIIGALLGKSLTPQLMNGGSVYPEWGDSGVYMRDPQGAAQNRQSARSQAQIEAENNTDTNMPNLANYNKFGTRDNIQGLPDPMSVQKMSIFLGNLSKLPDGQRSLNSPAMLKLLQDFQDRQQGGQAYKLQSAQPWFQKLHNLKQSYDI